MHERSDHRCKVMAATGPAWVHLVCPLVLPTSAFVYDSALYSSTATVEPRNSQQLARQAGSPAMRSPEEVKRPGDLYDMAAERGQQR